MLRLSGTFGMRLGNCLIRGHHFVEAPDRYEKNLAQGKSASGQTTVVEAVDGRLEAPD